MRLYATEKQCQQIIIALTEKYGDDEDALKMVKIVNDAMLMQCRYDKKKAGDNKSKSASKK